MVVTSSDGSQSANIFSTPWTFRQAVSDRNNSLANEFSTFDAWFKFRNYLSCLMLLLYIIWLLPGRLSVSVTTVDQVYYNNRPTRGKEKGVELHSLPHVRRMLVYYLLAILLSRRCLLGCDNAEVVKNVYCFPICSFLSVYSHQTPFTSVKISQGILLRTCVKWLQHESKQYRMPPPWSAAVAAFKFSFRVAAPKKDPGSFRIVAGGKACDDYTTDLSGLVSVPTAGWSTFQDVQV